jgi:hypothetical protein
LGPGPLGQANDLTVQLINHQLQGLNWKSRTVGRVQLQFARQGMVNRFQTHPLTPAVNYYFRNPVFGVLIAWLLTKVMAF